MEEILRKFWDAGVMHEASLDKRYSFEQILADNAQALQLLQPDVSGSLPFITRDELMKSLDDKRITVIGNLHPDIYYLSKKETAEHLLDVYIIQKRQ